MKRQQLQRLLLGFISAGAMCALSACAIIRQPAQSTPRMVDPGTAQLAKDIQMPQDAWPETRWWTRYQDAQLDRLIDFALARAPAIHVARARVEQAQAQLAVIRSGTRLQAVALGMVNRDHVSANGFLGAFAHDEPALGLTGPWYTEGIVGVGAHYDFDVWGERRSAVQAAVGMRNAQQAERAAVELLVTTNVARLYFQTQTLLHQEKLLQEAYAIMQTALAAHEARAARGLEPSPRVAEQHALLLQLEQQINLIQAEIRGQREVLRALIGAGPDELSDLSIAPIPTSQLGMPATLSYDLLARRPDLQLMRWYVQASVSQVSAAKAAFYPSLDIKAFLGFDSLHLSDLLQHGSRQVNMVPGLTLPIFDGGRLNANLQRAHAVNSEAIEQYNQAVLDAVREVAVAGVQLQALAQREPMQVAKLHEVEVVAASAEAHYARGLMSEADAATVRLPVIAQEAELLRIQGNQTAQQIRLIQALGGGFGPDSH